MKHVIERLDIILSSFNTAEQANKICEVLELERSDMSVSVKIDVDEICKNIREGAAAFERAWEDAYALKERIELENN